MIGSTNAAASVVVPAHDEAAVIGRLLDGLTRGGGPVLEIVVVCNGCTDDTEAIAAEFRPAVRVVSLPDASKRLALRRGDHDAVSYPRFYVDADVELTAADIAVMIEALRHSGVMAIAPDRVIPMDGVARPVRWYYDVWERLPQVRTGLFGRGVIGVTEDGNERLRSLPPMMGDDLVASEAFAPGERTVAAAATVIVRPPRTTRDLYRRRVRAATGNSQADASGLRNQGSVTVWSDLVSIGRREPTLIPKLPVFVAFAVASRIGASRALRRGDFDTWRRDDSSRR